MTAQVAADLRAAADVLRRDGWTQGVNERDGCRCLMGALSYVVSGGATSHDGPLYDDPDLRPRLRRSEQALVPTVGVLLTDWNDAPGRTADEVIAALEAAADAAEADQ